MSGSKGDKGPKETTEMISEESLDQTLREQDEMSRNLAAMIGGSLKIDDKSTKPKKKTPGKSPSKPTPTRKPPAAQQTSNPIPKITPKPSAPNISEDKDKKEFFESPEDLSHKLDTLAKWIKDSKHCIVFTGAGISTSTGIPDFRSGMNTVLKTGPGKWELQAKGVAATKGSTKISYLKAIPSVAHMAIVKLHQEGFVKFVISQNTDGLHLRSGIKPEQLAELHGNTNLEKCSKCGAKYLRDFRTRSSKKVHNHKTGRQCDNLKCRGDLVDSIINFGEDLPEKDINQGFEEADKSDLCIVLGSSLRVTPAANIPENVIRNGQRVVICNLQKTPLNPLCALEIHAQIDDIMVGVMQRLGLDIPSFTLNRRLAVDVSSNGKISFQGLDVTRDTPYSFLCKVDVKLIHTVGGKSTGEKLVLKHEPYAFQIPSNMKLKCLRLDAELRFQGHYNEPDATLSVKSLVTGRTVYLLCFNIADHGVWEIQQAKART